MEDFKFSTLEYKRPDFEKTGAFAEKITEKIKNTLLPKAANSELWKPVN